MTGLEGTPGPGHPRTSGRRAFLLVAGRGLHPAPRRSSVVRLLLRFDALGIVRVERAVESHEVERVLVHVDHELREPIGFGHGGVDALHHLALGVDVHTLRDVHHQDWPGGLRIKSTILAHAVERPFAEKDADVVGEGVRPVQSVVDPFHELSLLLDEDSLRDVEIRDGHVVFLSRFIGGQSVARRRRRDAARAYLSCLALVRGTELKQELESRSFGTLETAESDGIVKARSSETFSETGHDRMSSLYAARCPLTNRNERRNAPANRSVKDALGVALNAGANVVFANSSNVVGVVFDLERGSAFTRPELTFRLDSMARSAAFGVTPPLRRR